MSPVADYLSKAFSLEGCTALVTGGSRGIGAACAIAFASAGANIVLVQRNLDDTATKEAIESRGVKCTQVLCDLYDAEQVKGLVKTITQEKQINIDIVLNCGGTQKRTPAADFPDADWDTVMQINLNAVWQITRDAGKHMLERQKSGNGQQRRGKIINIASLLSFQGGLTVPAYAAAKHGVLGITKACSNEWTSQGINVNCIAPGYIATDMNEALIANPTRSRQILERIPAGKWGKPEDFAGPCLFLASPASDYVSGETLVVDGVCPLCCFSTFLIK